jgi:hypothetical protein
MNAASVLEDSCELGTSKIESPQAIPQGEGERTESTGAAFILGMVGITSAIGCLMSKIGRRWSLRICGGGVSGQDGRCGKEFKAAACLPPFFHRGPSRSSHAVIVSATERGRV